jgi:hypothetical protein
MEPRPWLVKGLPFAQTLVLYLITIKHQQLDQKGDKVGLIQLLWHLVGGREHGGLLKELHPLLEDVWQILHYFVHIDHEVFFFMVRIIGEMKEWREG